MRVIRREAIILAVAMLFSCMGGADSPEISRAEGRSPELSESKLTVRVGEETNISIINVKTKQIESLSAKIDKKKLATIVAKKRKVQVIAKEKGSGNITISLKLKNKIDGKKKYNLICKLKVRLSDQDSTASTPTSPISTSDPSVSVAPVTTQAPETTLAPAETGAPTASPASSAVPSVAPGASGGGLSSSGGSSGSSGGSSGSSGSSGSGGSSSSSGGGSSSGGSSGSGSSSSGGSGTSNTSPTASPSVTPTPTATPIVPVLESVVQSKANELKLTFNIDTNTSTTKLTKADIILNSLDSEGNVVSTIPAESMHVSTDGKIVNVSFGTAFKDGVKYKVGYNNKFIEFVGFMGRVETIKIDTVQAEQNVLTPIEFSLLDANGVDVTSTYDIKNTCKIEKTGDGTLEGENALSTTLTLSEVGQTATITITFTDPTDTSTRTLTATATITCVAATPKV